MKELQDFVQMEARALPVIILADVSSSMSGEKIVKLNESIKEMLSVFSESEELRAEIHVSVITFGASVEEYVPLQAARNIEWSDMQVSGATPMGEAMALAKDLIENKERIPSRSYRPTIILVSDGGPNDSGWERSMDALIHTGRSAKADRMAMAIGSDADKNMLQSFLDDPEKEVFVAEDASRISTFFKFVTMSVTSRSRSSNPNIVPSQGDIEAIVDDY